MNFRAIIQTLPLSFLFSFSILKDRNQILQGLSPLDDYLKTSGITENKGDI